MRISHLLVYVLLLAGFLLLGSLVWQVGITDLLTSFRAMGWWIVPWVLLEIVPVVLHTAAWAACFHKSSQAVAFWRLFVVRLAGSAINQVTPTATIGGEFVKVLLLESTLPIESLVWHGFGLLASTCYTRAWRGLHRVQPMARSSTPPPPC